MSGERVITEPLSLAHIRGFQAAVTDGKLWDRRYTSVPVPEEVVAYVEAALAQQLAV